MTHLIVLFNLRPGVERARYEQWAKATDLPIVRALPSVAGFELLRVTSLLGSEAPPPCEYVEVIRISDRAQFDRDVAQETMRRVAAEFREFADAPVFMLAGNVEQEADQ